MNKGETQNSGDYDSYFSMYAQIKRFNYGSLKHKDINFIKKRLGKYKITPKTSETLIYFLNFDEDVMNELLDIEIDLDSREIKRVIRSLMRLTKNRENILLWLDFDKWEKK
jgi:hypothetical protein